MKIICPYCGKELGEINNNIIAANGQIKCPYCNKGFGWHLMGKKIQRIW